MEVEEQPPTKIPKLSDPIVQMETEQERILSLLKERLEMHDSSRRAALDKLHEICDNIRAQINELEDKFSEELEKKFFPEDNRLQKAFIDLCTDKTVSALQKAKAELIVMQSYDVIEHKHKHRKKNIDDDNNNDIEETTSEFDFKTLCELNTKRYFILEMIETRRPTNVRVTGLNDNGRRVSVQFTCLNPYEERVLFQQNNENPVKYRCTIYKKGNEQKREEYPLDKKANNSFTFIPGNLEGEMTYRIKVRMVVNNRVSEWSDIAEFTTPKFTKCCVWKECPDNANDDSKYIVDANNARIATNINGDGYCTIIGNMPIPLNTVTSWFIKILKSRYVDKCGIIVGVAPFDIKQNVCNYYKCGWYFYGCNSTLWSGPPHCYNSKEYGPRKEDGQCVHTGGNVSVVMDTRNGNLSFYVGGVCYGVAYEGIPLDKPLVPCVLLLYEGDSVELVI